jgi:gas vesicle protein
MRKLISFLVGTAIGGIIGAGLALLFAPSSGADLRVKTGQRFEGFITEIRHAAQNKQIELQERLETLRAPRS